MLGREIQWNDAIECDKREGGRVGTAPSCVVREGFPQVFSLLADKKDMQLDRHEASQAYNLMCRVKTKWEVRAGHMWACVWRHTSSKYHQQKQEGMGWKQLRMRCNRLWLFPLAFIRLSYLICNGFHLVALIPQGSNNIQLPLFSFPHDSSLILNLCKCFITDGLKKSDRDD